MGCTLSEIATLRRRVNDARIAQAVTHPDVRELVLWVSHLLDESDPIRSASGNSGRSADPPLPYEPGRWVRGQQERIFSKIRGLSNDIQSVLQVPPDQRTAVDPEGRCVLCGRVSNPRTRHSSARSEGKATTRQQERIAELAGQVYGSVGEMEKQISVTVAELSRDAATRLIRTMKG